MTNTEIVLNQISIGQLQGRIKRFEMIEIGKESGGIPTGQTGRFNLQDQPQLRNQPNQIIIIRNVEIFPVTSYAASQYVSGVAGMPIAEIPKLAFVFYINGEESVKYIPLSKLIHVQDATPAPFQQELQGFDNLSNLDWDKSYLQYNTASANGPYIVPAGVTYFRFQRDPTNPDNWIEK